MRTIDARRNREWTITKTTEMRFRTDREIPWREIMMNNNEYITKDVQGIVLEFKPRTDDSKRVIKQLILAITGLLCLLLLAAGNLFAQVDPKRGFQPGNSYAISDIENINTTNGNVLINLPLVTLPNGRGEVGKSISLMYNSKLYDTRVEEVLDESNQLAFQNLLKKSETGGWRYAISGSYTLDVISRFEQSEPVPCGGSEDGKNAYAMKTVLHMPDGSRKEFRPTGFSDIYDDGFYAVMPSGYNVAGCGSGGLYTSGGMVYYSADGSYTKLVVDFVSGSTGRGEQNSWTLYMPDGSKVRKDSNGVRITDRNGNFVDGLTDNFGRSITLQKDALPNEDHITMRGINNEELKWVVKWKTITFSKQYKTTGSGGGIGRGGTSSQTLSMSLKVVDRITLPTQLGNLFYEFNYNTESSLGYGEISRVTTPSGATSEYEYKWDTNIFAPILPTVDFILENSVNKKTLTYLEENDGGSNSVSDVWTYSINKTTSSVTAPNGTVTTQSYGDTSFENALQGLVYKSSDSNGNITEKIWASNRPTGTSQNTLKSINTYVKTDFTTVADASGNPSLTKIVDYTYDKNGNVTETREYDWVAYSSVQHATTGPPLVTGIPSGATLKRIITNVYYNPASTPANGYWSLGSPARRNAIKSTTVKTAAGTPVSHSEFFYDNPATTGNVTQVKVWDSSKGTYSNPLSGSNSISTTTTFDTFGNPLIATDANGVQSKITYGAVSTFSGLYPTQTESAFGTTVERTSTAQYDFYTGAITQSTDVDNNVSSATEYDALARPTKVIAAVGTPNEIWTETEYGDVSRRVITRSDLEVKGDGKIVSIQHFDQLGRVRLVRSLENATTQDPYNESHGIKVQTRYETTNPYSYSVSSNPYRASTSGGAGSEETMGWTRSKAWNTGRKSETESFSGASLPAPWGSNSTSTGRVISESDADASTVTDQAGKKRRSLTNALGQLTRVDEPDSSGNLGSLTSPVQGTSYSYDTLNNLKTVSQGVQTRTFSYTSLSRLLSAVNPESGTIIYTYDSNGNLLTKKDARNVTTTFAYDQLNRAKTRSYSDGTPAVTYTYDNLTNAKGLLTKVSSSVSTTEFTSFDVLGKVLTHKQTTDGNVYNTSYLYNLSGALIEETYPSGRKVKNTLDSIGRLSKAETKTATGAFETRADNFSYLAHGAASSIKLGNNNWESTEFNTRLQPTRIALGTSQNSTNLLKLDYSYGTTGNNGNVLSQTITTPTAGTATGFTAVQTYTYDSLNRIKDAKELIGASQAWKQTFNYDRYGNRNFDVANTTTISSCPVNQCNPTVNTSNNRFNSGQGYSYDSSGNVISDAEGRTFIYDGENKQKEVKNSSNQVIGTYYYDGDGKRIKKVTASEQITFVFDADGKLVGEYSTVTPQVTAVTRYLTNDHLGSPRIITDGTGNVISRRDFMPFGEEAFVGTGSRATGHGYTSNGDSTKQKFTGYERDVESNLDFAQERYHDFELGRFRSPDPLNESMDQLLPQSMNRYTYVMNNPLFFIDPSGLIWVQAAGCSGEKCQPQWIDDAEWGKYSDDERKPYEIVKNLTYDSVSGNQVVLDPNGPSDDNPAGWTFGGSNSGSGAGGLVMAAGVVAVADSPVPGPADIGAIVILGVAGYVALTSEGAHMLPLDPNIFNKNKDIEKKVTGLIKAAQTELAKLATDPPGPDGPQNHHRKEIKAMLKKAKAKLKRHGGGAKKKLLEQIKKIEKAANKIMGGS